MPLGHYIVNYPTLALFHEDEREVAQMVPVGSFITVDDRAVFEGPAKLIEVTWGDRRVMMFTHDLQSRAELVD